MFWWLRQMKNSMEGERAWTRPDLTFVRTSWQSVSKQFLDILSFTLHRRLWAVKQELQRHITSKLELNFKKTSKFGSTNTQRSFSMFMASCSSFSVIAFLDLRFSRKVRSSTRLTLSASPPTISLDCSWVTTRSNNRGTTLMLVLENAERTLLEHC